MGLLSSRFSTPGKYMDGSNLFTDKEDDVENGFSLCGHYLPEEILVVLLSHLDHKTLLSCRRVCHVWHELIDETVFYMKFKAERYKYKSGKAVDLSRNFGWQLYYSIFKNDPFGRNLIKNHCGQNGLRFWEIRSNGGDRLKIENPPVGSDPLPSSNDFNGLSCCFVTSYHSCTKQQIINLRNEGISSYVMDNLQPVIVASDWYANRFDCACIYDIEISLLNEEREEVHRFANRYRMAAGENTMWQQVKHEFRNYGRGIRYVKFYHGGMDSQFWAGHYGCKMSGASVNVYLL